MTMDSAKNVLGTALQPCCYELITGWFRDGFCNTDALDTGIHTVCVVVDDRFLTYSKSMGNDLSTPMPEYQFLGLKAGDKWCFVQPDGNKPMMMAWLALYFWKLPMNGRWTWFRWKRWNPLRLYPPQQKASVWGLYSLLYAYVVLTF